MAVAQKLEELVAWQLSTRLRNAVIDRSGSWRTRDTKLFDQIRDSARSAPRNLAEGFGRFKPREFAHFARIARGSLLETLNHLEEALRCDYIQSEEAQLLLRLNKRALKATTMLVKYLDSCKGKAPTGWDVAEEQTSGPAKKRSNH